MRLEDVDAPEPGPARCAARARRVAELPGRADVPRRVPGEAAAAVHARRRGGRRGRRARRRRRPASRSATGCSRSRTSATAASPSTRPPRVAAGVFPIPDVDVVRGGVGAARHVPDRPSRAAPPRRICSRARRCSCTRARAVSAARRSSSGSRPARVSSRPPAARRRWRCAASSARDLAIDYREHDFVDAVKEFTDGRGADVIYDPVGGDTYDRSTKCIAFEGRILIIGFTGGRFAEARTNHVLIKNYSVVGVHWGLYNLMKPAFVRDTHDELMRLFEAGQIDPLISRDGRPRRRCPRRSRASAAAAPTASSSASCDASSRPRTYVTERAVHDRREPRGPAGDLPVPATAACDLERGTRSRRTARRRAGARRRVRQRDVPRCAARSAHRGPVVGMDLRRGCSPPPAPGHRRAR